MFVSLAGMQAFRLQHRFIHIKSDTDVSMAKARRAFATSKWRTCHTHKMRHGQILQQGLTMCRGAVTLHSGMQMQLRLAHDGNAPWWLTEGRCMSIDTGEEACASCLH